MAQKINEAEGILMNVLDKGEKILPKDGETNVLITSALPYCNNVPHLGNIIGSTLSADVFARYNRVRNRRTLYVCGTDEYGTATETQALKEGITPQALCDKYYTLQKETYEWFQLGFDHFGRTSTRQHTDICQEVFLNLRTNGFLEKQTKDQTYCEGCARYLADRFVEGTCPNCGYIDARGDQCDDCSRTLDAIDLLNPRCLVNKTHEIVPRASTHMYVSLDKIQPRTEEWIKKSWKAGKWSPNSVINADGELIDSRLKGGLRPSPFTRDLTWGVKVPQYEGVEEDGVKDKVLYVWFDAPFGYPSITANYTPEWKKWWFDQENVRLYQFMGKDNVYFHTVFWPSVLLADGRDWTTLHHLSTTEYLQYESGKFSKSRNIGVFGPAAKSTGIPPAVWRYYLLSTRPETADSTFSWNDFIAANNNVLLNNFGNFVNRVIKFASSKYDGKVPASTDAPGLITSTPLADDLDPTFVQEINDLLTDYLIAMESVKLRLGIQTVMLLSARGNLYLQRSALGNALFADHPGRCALVISRALNLIWALSAVVHPFMPGSSASILEQLNVPARTIPEKLSTDILAGHELGKPAYLFTKIEEKMAGVWRAQFGGNQNQDAPPAPAPVSKRKAAAAAKKDTNPAGKEIAKTPEILELEKKVKEQGEKVRRIKEGKEEGEVKEQLAELLRLKKELADEIAKL